MSTFCWKLSAIFAKTKGWDHLCTSVPGGLGLCSHRSHQLLGHADILHLGIQVDSGVRVIIRYPVLRYLVTQEFSYSDTVSVKLISQRYSDVSVIHQNKGDIEKSDEIS